MHEGFREHRAERHEAAAEHDWQVRHDAYVELIGTARTFDGAPAPEGLLLAPGETVFLHVAGCALVEERRGQGTYVGHSQGVSVPVVRIGGRQIRYRVGATKGHYVQGTPTPTAVDTGATVITSTRVIFQGTRQTRQCPFARLVGYQPRCRRQHHLLPLEPVHPRHHPLRHGRRWPTFDFRLELALAHFRGTVDDLVSGLVADLAAIDAARPAAPAPGRAHRGRAPLRLRTLHPATPSGSGHRPTTPRARRHRRPRNPVASTVQAGWYPDPWGAAPLRWWDGRAWSWQTAAPGSPGGG